MRIVQYEKSFGEYALPDGLREKLCKLPVEEQLNYFRTSSSCEVSRTNWSERTEESGLRRVETDGEVKAIIVDDGVVVGVIVKDDSGQDAACFVGKGVCTYYACDNNGAGYIERVDFFYLVAVPENLGDESNA